MSSERQLYPDGLFDQTLDWDQRLQIIVATMREMSTQHDPQAMVRAYGQRMSQLFPRDAMVSLSRRGMQAPHYRITRASRWGEEVNPWKEQQRLPAFSGGLLAELIYGDEPRIINEVSLAADEPAREYLDGHRSLVAIPLFDDGVALNMVVFLQREAGFFRPEYLPELVWTGNLFGRATHNLVLREQLEQAYRVVDDELKMVADIQRSLLPEQLPDTQGIELAVHYQTSRRAGGDYYDFFPFEDGRLGILVADVSGHGTPAAVLMAITHSLVHSAQAHWDPPSRLLAELNRRLSARYTTSSGHFVTAFYGIFDPDSRRLVYSAAGHPAPRVKGCGGPMALLNQARGLPLGIEAQIELEDAEHALAPADQIVFYTDGITEAASPGGEFFGVDRLDASLGKCQGEAQAIIQRVLDDLEAFTAGQPADDDRTLLVAKIA